MGSPTNGAVVGTPLRPPAAVGQTVAQSCAGDPPPLAGLRLSAPAAGSMDGARGYLLALRLDGQYPVRPPSPARSPAPAKLSGSVSRTCKGTVFALKTGSCSDRAAVFLVVALLHKPSHFLLDLERHCCTIRPIPDPLRCFGKPPVFDSREDRCCCSHWIFPPLWGHPPTPSLLCCAVFPIGMIRKGASTSRVSSKVRPCWASIASS